MDQNYNSRKRKIYNDYSSVPYERLIEMVKNKSDFSKDVIEVIKDILRERGASIPAEGNQEYVFSPPASSSFHDNPNSPDTHNGGTVSFVEKYRGKENEEIIFTITRYSEFQPEAVEAALTVAVDKGLISFDLRNALSVQISSNTSKHWKRYRTFEWEKNNAFIEFVKGYTDDEIYNILEDPSGIVIDVYHAVLVTAVNRELISNEEFNSYYDGAKKVLKDDQIENELFNDIIVHPSTREITREFIKDSKPGIAPFLLIGLAIILIAGSIILRELIRGHDPVHGLLLFCGIMVVVILYNLIFKKKRK